MGSLTEPLPLSLRFSSIVCLLARQPKPRDRSLSSAVCHAQSPKYTRSHDFARNRLDPSAAKLPVEPFLLRRFLHMFLLVRAAILFPQMSYNRCLSASIQKAA